MSESVISTPRSFRALSARRSEITRTAVAWQSYRNAQTEAVFAPSTLDGHSTAPPLDRTG